MAKVGRASRNASHLRVETISADKTIESAETGETYFIDASSAGNFTITLPAAKAGYYFTFVFVAASNAAAEVLIDAGSGSTIKGNTIVQAAAGSDTKAAHSNQKLGFADATELGSGVSLVCDGTDWFIVGNALGSATFVTSFS
tara:strand:+ start:180 stop:608 length:429 start_codon:yes stop_codon:yes gene_type:complete